MAPAGDSPTNCCRTTRWGARCTPAWPTGPVTSSGWCSTTPRPAATRRSVSPHPSPTRCGAGLWHTAGSVEELAEATGLDPAALRESVDRFNGFAEQGRDADFARGEDPYGRFFLGAATADQCLRPVGGDQLHAVRLVLGDLGTKGGAVIDANGAAVDADGRPIPGLYAAGNSSASVSGEAYPGPGVPLGSGMTMAYRAVADMAGQALPIAP
nr:FAD-binding protein [Dietzia maris]